jgi:hypothetical protein
MGAETAETGQKRGHNIKPATPPPGSGIRDGIRTTSADGDEISKASPKLEKSGKYTPVWDGNDARGREVANGIYFYRLDTP